MFPNKKSDEYPQIVVMASVRTHTHNFPIPKYISMVGHGGGVPPLLTHIQLHEYTYGQQAALWSLVFKGVLQFAHFTMQPEKTESKHQKKKTKPRYHQQNHTALNS